MSADPVSLTGRSVHMLQAGTTVEIGRKLGEGSQGIVHEALLDGRPVAVKWLRDGPFAAELRESLARLARRGSPHPSFVWPIDLVESPDVTGFGYVMPLLERRFVSLAAVLSEPVQPPFRVLVGVGRGIVDCFAALHAAGLCYRDVNFGNLRVDPASAVVRIIDCDNVGVDGERAFVKGSLRFMAPEIVRGEALPSSTTDFFSLAVLLFHLLVHGHPLDGSRTDESWDWTSGLDEYGIAVRNLGEQPLFVFDPADPANRPRDGDPMLTWWPIYPRFLRELFERAFTGGMRDPSSPDRFTEGRWRRALGRLADSLTVCPSCRAAIVWDADDLAKPCWNCRAVPPPPWLLHVPGHDVVLADGATVTASHLRDQRERDAVLAAVERHPQRPDEIVLRNMGDRAWSVRPAEEEGVVKEVAPGQRLRVRTMAIDFGTVSGWIAHAGDAVPGP